MKARAKIRFLLSAGGNEDYPVQEGQYLSTPAVWEDLPEGESWPLVVQFVGQKSMIGIVMTEVEFLNPRKAPSDKLKPGFKFTLMDGERKLALGEVTSVIEV